MGHWSKSLHNYRKPPDTTITKFEDAGYLRTTGHGF